MRTPDLSSIPDLSGTLMCCFFFLSFFLLIGRVFFNPIRICKVPLPYMGAGIAGTLSVSGLIMAQFAWDVTRISFWFSMSGSFDSLLSTPRFPEF